MKEGIVTSPHQWEVRDVPVQEITDDHDVLIQMKAAGVCGSDHKPAVKKVAILFD